MPEDKKNVEDVWKGIGLLALLHLILFVVPLAFAFIGLVQWLYILPAVAIFRQMGRTGLAQGLLIGGAVTFLINSACFGYSVINPRFFFGG